MAHQQSIREKVLANQVQFFGNKAFQATDFQGNSPPSIFVSWKNYPNVTIAPMSLPQHVKDADIFDNPERWLDLSTEDILTFRQSLIRGNTRVAVQDAAAPDKKLQTLQELAMAKRPFDVDLALQKRPDTVLEFNRFNAPLGPQAPLKALEFRENPSVHRKVDYLVSDTQAKSTASLLELFEAGIPLHTLEKLLSAGLLGVQKERKLVPTRWSITAVDSTISKHVVEEVRQLQELGEVQLYHSSHFFNVFYVLLVPGHFAFEEMEAWQAQSNGQTVHQFSVDHEFFKGRTTYAKNTEGAYYAARLAVAEHLRSMKRQAQCIVFREISPEYTSLGVWSIRENVRDAFKGKPLLFNDISLALAYLGTRLSIPLQEWLKHSKLLDAIRNQKRITDYF